jgi:hypothetical protein
MDMDHPSAGSSAGPITFSLGLPRLALEGTIAISPSVGDSAVVAIELQLAGIPLGTATLTEQGALDLALRLVGTVMTRRKAAMLRSTAPRPSVRDRPPAVPCPGGMQPSDAP